ncbi:MAG: type III pantothenate kinase [Bdellovibrionota bacterium]
MTGLITLDFGNTNATAGIFSIEGKTATLIKKVPLSELRIFLTQLDFSAHNAQIAISDVKPRDEELKVFVEEGYLITRVREYWRGKKFHGMTVNYADTVGEDRLITAFYTFKNFKTNCLIIDAGTFVTMDVVTPSGFEGGYIIPGPETYFTNFSSGENLRSFTLNATTERSLPHDTPGAMSGSYGAFAALARELIEKHQIQKVLITGGGSPLWEQYLADLKAPPVVETLPDLIHSSLLYWMTTQIEPL